MNTYFFTFGSNHYDEYGHNLFNCYTMIEAHSEDDARRIMTAYRGNKWSMVYKTAEDAGVNTYNLIYIPITQLSITKKYE